MLNKLGTLQQISHLLKVKKGYEVTGEEGFVAVDRMGNALKLVDRLEFSRQNFQTGMPRK